MSYAELSHFYGWPRPGGCEITIGHAQDGARGQWYQILDRNVRHLQGTWESPSNAIYETMADINVVRQPGSKSLQHSREWNIQHWQAPTKSLIETIRSDRHNLLLRKCSFWEEMRSRRFINSTQKVPSSGKFYEDIKPVHLCNRSHWNLNKFKGPLIPLNSQPDSPIWQHRANGLVADSSKTLLISAVYSYIRIRI